MEIFGGDLCPVAAPSCGRRSTDMKILSSKLNSLLNKVKSSKQTLKRYFTAKNKTTNNKTMIQMILSINGVKVISSKGDNQTSIIIIEY